MQIAHHMWAMIAPFTHVTPLNQNTNCLMLWIKLAIARDFIHLVYGLHSPRSYHLYGDGI